MLRTAVVVFVVGAFLGVTVVVAASLLFLADFQLVDAETFLILAAAGFTLLVAILEAMVAVVLACTTG